MRDALKEHSAATRELVAALGDLRVAESRIAHPDQTLVSDVEQLRTVRREHALATQRLEQLIDAERRATERGAALAAVLGTHDRSDSRRSSRRPSDGMPRPRPRERARELQPRATASAERARAAGDRLAQLESLVRSASPSDDESDGLERLHAAAARRVAADQRERSLIEGVPELDSLLATAREREARGESLVLSDDEHATLVADMREARARAEELVLREQDLSARLDRLGAARTVGDVEGELHAVEAELAGIRRERDRLALAAAIVRRAEREVRERYAPAWLQAASRYLEAITHGRYSGVAIVETPAGEPVLEVTRSGEALPVRVGPPLSRGTLEQIYVAVRLALVDAIDAEARLPLFLDELFAHWDAQRLDALAGCSGGRWASGAGLHLPCRAGRPARALVWRARRGARGTGRRDRSAGTAPAGRGHRSARAGGPDASRSARGLRPAPTLVHIRREQAPMIRLQATSRSARPATLENSSKVRAWQRPPSERRSPPRA